MKKYFAYIRVSTKEQEFEEQRRAVAEYAVREHLTISTWFEEKQTAATLGRTVFTRMLAQLGRGEADGLIVHKVDRSARNLKDWANLGDLIDKGVDVRFAHDRLDVSSRSGRLAADVQAIVAADFIRNLREEIAKGQRGRLHQGIYPFAAPVGYLNLGKAMPKAPDPVNAPLVRQAFELYARGTMGLKDLQREMKLRGLRSPRSGKPISLSAISTMLNNPFYIGLMHIKRTGETYPGKHTPIVTKALFEGATLMNIASTGARIRISKQQELPDTFFLIDLAEKTAYLCAVMNHTAGVYGVKFVNRHPLSGLPPTLSFLSAIWMDFARR